jgi:hypothetical protein
MSTRRYNEGGIIFSSVSASAMRLASMLCQWRCGRDGGGGGSRRKRTRMVEERGKYKDVCVIGRRASVERVLTRDESKKKAKKYGTYAKHNAHTSS